MKVPKPSKAPKKPSKFYIYKLIDPRNGRPFWIGKTRNPRNRLEVHRCALKDHFDKWILIQEIEASGERVRMVIMGSYDDYDEACVREHEAIIEGRTAGEPLLNKNLPAKPRRFDGSHEAREALKQQTEQKRQGRLRAAALARQRRTLALARDGALDEIFATLDKLG